MPKGMHTVTPGTALCISGGQTWSLGSLKNSPHERAPHAARVSASQAILDRAYGKAPTLNTSDPTVMKRAIDMTDEELAAIASGATLHVVK